MRCVGPRGLRDLDREPKPVPGSAANAWSSSAEMMGRALHHGAFVTLALWLAMVSSTRAQETSVAKVLLNHREFEFGRFAARYRRLFGGLPSETLRAKRS